MKWVCAAIAAAVLVGCSGGSSEPATTKEDFGKTAPPPGWKGPESTAPTSPGN